ncbi:MAG TPA: zinc ribbon domain-containing protein [Thermoclostridium caenicola]|uniref:Zinc-ribbon domain-containing protein n=1 Tax=Thermoclostridium caenicola TaxID=659425 RepID=A0A1M6HKY8_9FIRM|nr:zinc ribbon domain-containing protein [Thermoclostridium caenicola]SHJ22841.1 zinc-ribbon domain-containing protein [Thermoclostridium caenicola]HOK42937.1 zinc ribbon domain-containing protein [Thermoclostridium caenicola]HOL84163.1 zinc ribbon domain-containing protein [Thermoclostridium caenicola]HOP72601.1 zinc ribbon domain-containing protein [Thermoclostridium caenicola]HPO76236.1 zinc ribbon domain-containing protein [Thermoclostridium caenicola]
MFCTNCGKEVADSASFCTACGAKIAREPAVEQQTVTSAPVSATTPSAEAQQSAPVTVSGSESPKKKNNSIFIAIAAVAAVIILAVLIFGGGGGGYKEYKELARAYYEAVYNKDVNAMIKLFDKDAQKDLKKDKDFIKEKLEEMKEEMDDYYGRGWLKDVKPGSRERASTRGAYKVEIEIDGEFHEYLYIKKDDKDRYYIHEDYSDF